jgi:hypothetical protein
MRCKLPCIYAATLTFKQQYKGDGRGGGVNQGACCIIVNEDAEEKTQEQDCSHNLRSLHLQI